MSWLKTIAQEVLGLFVDDAGFAVSILAWVVACLVLSWLGVAALWTGCILFAGLAAILVESAIRRSRP